MSTVNDVIRVLEVDGIEECITLVTTEIEQEFGNHGTLSQSGGRRFVASLLAKYKNLNKNQHNQSAESEMKRFLSSSVLSLAAKEVECEGSSRPAKLPSEPPPHTSLPENLKPIGYMDSVFHYKNGTPRQSGICKTAVGKLAILRSLFNNPEHSLMDLDQFSHIWVVFWFHQNTNDYYKAKVKPPRLNGKSTGVFSTRSPYRPNPIGLTLAKIESIQGDTLYLSGIDIVNGTPVLDIKPYIASYDQPSLEDFSASDASTKECLLTDNEAVRQNTVITDKCLGEPVSQPKSGKMESKTAEWITKPPIQKLTVRFTTNALSQLSNFSSMSSDPNYKLDYLPHSKALQEAITDILKADPRSTYRRNHCDDRLYYFVVDKAHITSWFDDTVAEVLRVKSAKEVDFKTNKACSE